jgi:hypothetical protein
MNLVVALLTGLLTVAAVAHLVRTIALDGYGTRPPPRSHPEELGPLPLQEMQR